MELEFKRPNLPNFIRCEQGVFPIKDLSKEDIESYIRFWKFSLLHKWESSQEDKK